MPTLDVLIDYLPNLKSLTIQGGVVEEQQEEELLMQIINKRFRRNNAKMFTNYNV